jgi:phosphoglycolate phosphatase
MTPSSLILFDVDATLITTSRSGIAAMGDSGVELFGPGFTTERTDFAGRLDTLIIRDLLRDNGLAPTPALEAAMREGYRRHLERRLADRSLARTLEGVPALLDALEAAAMAALGLLTGNFPETGRIKLAACGLDVDRFHIHVWGTDSPHEPSRGNPKFEPNPRTDRHALDSLEGSPRGPLPAREHLPPVAMARFRERFGRPLAPAAVTIIGDTPHDIACARAHGCRSIGVATGPYSREALEAAGADLALDNLADTARILRWLDGRSV